MRRPLVALGLGVVAASQGVAAEPNRLIVAPLVPCPPVVIPCQPGTVMPGSPGVPYTPQGTPEVPTNPQGTPPGTTPPGTTPPPGSDFGGGGFARQSEGGTQVAQSFAPNIFGDLLGARGFQVSYQTNASARFRLVGADFLADGSRGVVVSPTGNGRGIMTFVNPNGSNTTVDLTTVAAGRNLDFVQPVTPANALDTTFSTQALELLLSKGVITAAQMAQLDRLTPSQRAQLLQNRGVLNSAITQALGGLATPNVQVGGVVGSVAAGDVLYNFAVRSDALFALPGSGSTIGRVKISEDNNPIPRDRFIFTYDNFDSVPFNTFGTTVNRYQLGVEKTFFDGRWSAEFRIPFGGTLANTSVQGSEVSNVELGNIRFAFKRIMTQNSWLLTSAGVALTLPTASDQTLLSAFDGSTLLHFKNESVTLEPFVAALFTPNERLFSQLWGSVNFDASGGQFTWNRDVFGGSGSARVKDAPVLAVDYQVGYWMIQNDTGRLRRLAPFAELHWNSVLGQSDAIRQLNSNPGSGLTIVGMGDQELNMSAGLLAQIGNNLNVSVGASFPLLQKPDRTFDAQIGVRASYLFGRTARARNPIYSINSF